MLGNTASTPHPNLDSLKAKYFDPYKPLCSGFEELFREAAAALDVNPNASSRQIADLLIRFSWFLTKKGETRQLPDKFDPLQIQAINCLFESLNRFLGRNLSDVYLPQAIDAFAQVLEKHPDLPTFSAARILINNLLLRISGPNLEASISLLRRLPKETAFVVAADGIAHLAQNEKVTADNIAEGLQILRTKLPAQNPLTGDDNAAADELFANLEPLLDKKYGDIFKVVDALIKLIIQHPGLQIRSQILFQLLYQRLPKSLLPKVIGITDKLSFEMAANAGAYITYNPAVLREEYYRLFTDVIHAVESSFRKRTEKILNPGEINAWLTFEKAIKTLTGPMRNSWVLVETPLNDLAKDVVKNLPPTLGSSRY